MRFNALTPSKTKNIYEIPRNIKTGYRQAIQTIVPEENQNTTEGAEGLQRH
jgi:hypothetical protein